MKMCAPRARLEEVTMSGTRLAGWTVLLALLLMPASNAAAQGSIDVSVSATATCAQALFEVAVVGSAAGVDLAWEFGDGETLAEQAVAAFPHEVAHTYPAAGEYGWILTVSPSGETEEVASASGTLHVGPTVDLTSDPFPPLLTLAEGSARIVLTAAADGAQPVTLEWEVGGASTTEAVDDVSIAAVFSAPGKYTATATAADACGLTANDSLTILVEDPEAEACHPVAQRIADAANALFPLQGEDLYACEDILSLFRGTDEPGDQIGFGRIWHAIRLAELIPDLTWEEILDWHLDQGGWGVLVQLHQMAQVAGDTDLAQLMERVRTGETTLKQVREAYRLATRDGAPFDETLDDLVAGVDPKALRLAYRASAELGLSVDEILGYGAAGITPQEIQHAQRLGEDSGQDWAFLLQQHADGESWGQLKHAQGEMPEGAPGASSPEPGKNGPGNAEAGKPDPGNGAGQPPESPDDSIRSQTRTAERLAAQFQVSVQAVMAIYQDACSLDWNCVRTRLMEQAHLEAGDDKPHKGK
jgi:hypothetical protein